MLRANGKMKYVIGALIALGLLLSFFVAHTITTYKKEAQSSVNKFCEMFKLGCTDLHPSLSWTDPNALLGLISEPTLKLSCGDIEIHFTSVDQYGHRSQPISFIVGRHSGEIATYSNRRLYFEMENKYGVKDSESKAIAWPHFMSEEDAKRAISSIADRLKLPADMTLQTIKQNYKKGVWTAVWQRELNGYRYEKDRMLVSIMGATGEFVEYLKTYKGHPCPTEVRLSQQEITKRGWSRFIEKLPTSLRGKAHTLYGTDVSLRIVQPRVFSWLPTEKNESRLAWIVSFYFTGGIEYKSPNNSSESEQEAAAAAISNQFRKWHELGKPPRSYEVRYDAATGEILTESRIAPSCLRGLTK